MWDEPNDASFRHDPDAWLFLAEFNSCCSTTYAHIFSLLVEESCVHWLMNDFTGEDSVSWWSMVNVLLILNSLGSSELFWICQLFSTPLKKLFRFNTWILLLILGLFTGSMKLFSNGVSKITECNLARWLL